MKDPEEPKFKIDSSDTLMFFVLGLLICGICFVWYNQFPFYLALIITIVILFSMYYQIMFWVKQLSLVMLFMNIQDRIINEYTYQIMKRDYFIRVKTIIEDPTRMDSNEKIKFETNMPKWKKYYVLPITILMVILFPAWRIREFEGQDDVWD